MKRLRHPGRGAPIIDDRAEILTHFETQMRLGHSISKIARQGLTLLGQQFKDDGQLGVVVLRTIKAGTLERRYRRLLKEVERLQDGLSVPGARYVGISGSLISLSFSRPAARKRGRPRKNA